MARDRYVPFAHQLGPAIQVARIHRAMPLAELAFRTAEALDATFTPNDLHLVEGGNAPVTVDLLDAICQVLDVAAGRIVAMAEDLERRAGDEGETLAELKRLLEERLDPERN